MVLDYKLDGAFIGGTVENQETEQEFLFNGELVIASELTIESIEAIGNPNLLVFPQGCSYRSVLENWLHKKAPLSFTRASSSRPFPCPAAIFSLLCSKPPATREHVLR